MAKDSFILHGGSGSTGSVTTYRRDGRQIVRERVRVIANPKTTSQARQRNFLAPIAKFYAPLAAVLEKSYEGLNKSKSYSAFLKKNIELARKHGYYLPKGTPFYPMPYQVSRGTLQPMNASVSVMDDGPGGTNTVNYVIPSDTVPGTPVTTMADLSAYILADGYLNGDQITVIGICENSDEYYPIFERFFLSDTDTRNVADVITKFDVAIQGTGQNAKYLGFEPKQGYLVAGVMIASRYENGAWRRSTEIVDVAGFINNMLISGSQAEIAIASYQDANTTHLSDVYLNGQNRILVATAQDGTLVELDTIREVTRMVADTPTNVLIALDSNGKELYLMNKIEGAASANKVLASKSGYVTTNPTDVDAKNTVVFNASDSRVASWLKVKGVAQSVFQ